MEYDFGNEKIKFGLLPFIYVQLPIFDHLNVMVPLEQAMERNFLLVVRRSSDCQVVSSTRRWLERSPRVEDCSSGCQMLDHASMQICKIASN
jgi:hypothetical protein